MDRNPFVSNFLLAPTGDAVAIRLPNSIAGQQGAPWHCTDGSRLRDDQVRGWSPLATMSLSKVLELERIQRALGERD